MKSKRSLGRTRRLYILKTIRANIASFLVLLIFSCLSVGFYTGVGWGGASMNKSICGYCEDNNMYDLVLSSPAGFSDRDISDIASLEGIGTAEGGYLSYGVFKADELCVSAKIQSVPEKISLLSVHEGSLPENEDEAAVEETWARENGISVGSILELKEANDQLSAGSFRVTALVESPAYFGTNTIFYESAAGSGLPINTVLFMPSAAFANTELTGCQQVFLKGDGLDGLSIGSPEYSEAVSSLKESVEENVSVPCTVMTSEQTPSFVVLQTTLDMFSNFRYTMSVPLIVICLLISVAVILRVTSNEARFIGIQLAMGTPKAAAAATYILFCNIPVLAGSILGTLIGRYYAEPVLVNAVEAFWVFEKRISVFDAGEALLMIAILVVAINAAAAISCLYIFRKNALELINGFDIPYLKPRLYERTRLWERLPLLTKSIIKNVRTDRIRVAVTLLGIIGCTLLSVSGLYFSHTIRKSFDEQFEQVQDYELIVYFDPEAEAESAVAEKLEELGIRSTPVYTDTVYLNAPDGKTLPASVLVSDREFDGLIHFYAMNGDGMPLGNGALVSGPYGNYYNIAENSVIRFTDGLAEKHDVSVSGVFRFFLTRQQLVFTKQCYEELTGRRVANNALLLSKNTMSPSEINAALSGSPGSCFAYDYKTTMQKSFSLYERISGVISGMQIAFSLAYAFFMLLNIFTQFVSEKKRELITMMVNGYDVRFAQKYLYLDTVFLATAGIIIGAVLGNVDGIINTSTMLSAFTYFPGSVDMFSCVAGIGISALFTTVMCIYALKGIGKLKISDISKT